MQWHRDHLGAGPLPARINLGSLFSTSLSARLLQINIFGGLLGHQPLGDPAGKGWDITTTVHIHPPSSFLGFQQGSVSGYGFICVFAVGSHIIKDPL